LFAAAGLPEGALDGAVGGGAELGAALVEAEWVNLVTFTGSAAVGWGLRARAGRKKLTLELGNNGAVVVRRDADLALAVESCVRGAYAHAGQTCISVQRIFVEAEVEQEFCRRFVEKAAGLRVGHPMAEETEMASLITENEARRVENWIAEADGEVMLQGERRGAVLGPSLVRGAAEHSKLMREEAFGPVAAVVRVKDLDEAIVRVNDSRFGLQAGIFTRDFAAAWRFAREVECGGVMINDASNFRVDQMPYGGVKESGVGREGPRYALEEMTERKLVSWRCGE
jgi:acyl-CoA reductase-like NAD-dependent aldehyde dehydrogenase